MAFTITIGQITSPYIVSWKLRYRVKGTNTWLTSNLSPSLPTNGYDTSVSSVTVSPQYDNTIYEYQTITKCGSNEINSSIYTKINRGCPTLLSQSIVTTDTSISLNFPLNTPVPLSNHIQSITVVLKQGSTLISTQTLTSINSTNTVSFTNLTENTTYNIEYTITFVSEDFPVSLYTGDNTSNTHKCTLAVTTEPSPECPDIIIVSVTQS